MLNIAMKKAKKDLLVEKTKISIQAQVQTYDITAFVSDAWKKSFARVNKNKSAIADRGWHHLNRNLLLYPRFEQ